MSKKKKNEKFQQWNNCCKNEQLVSWDCFCSWGCDCCDLSWECPTCGWKYTDNKIKAWFKMIKH
jgi:hypothetical protein